MYTRMHACTQTRFSDLWKYKITPGNLVAVVLMNTERWKKLIGFLQDMLRYKAIRRRHPNS